MGPHDCRRAPGSEPRRRLHPGHRLRREFLLRQWQEDHPAITLSLSTVTGTSFVPGVMTERAAGKYLWDVFESGPGTGISAAQ